MTKEELERLRNVKKDARLAYLEYKAADTIESDIAERRLCQKKIEADIAYTTALAKYVEENP